MPERSSQKGQVLWRWQPSMLPRTSESVEHAAEQNESHDRRGVAADVCVLLGEYWVVVDSKHRVLVLDVADLLSTMHINLCYSANCYLYYYAYEGYATCYMLHDYMLVKVVITSVSKSKSK